MKLTSRAARGIVITAAACAAAMAPAIALASTGGVARPATTAFPSCETPNLVIWLDTNGSGAAGSTFYKLNFTNLGPTCTLNGFPFLYAINLTGHQIGKRASFDGPTPAVRVIHSQKTATAILQIANAHLFSKALCGKVVTAAGLKVFPPNQTRSKSIPFPFPVCTSMSAHVLGVGSVK